MKQKERYEWKKSRHNIFESFAVDLQQFWKGGGKTENGSRMLNQSLKKQRDYMKQSGLRMEYEMKPNGHLAKQAVTAGWKDLVFSNRMECRTCAMQRKIYQGDQLLYRHKENVSLYVTITDVLQGKNPAKEKHNCPNCGAVCTVEQLQEMCPSCQTRFHISELYPKVTNFYTVRSYGGTEKEMKAEVRKICLPVMLLSILYFCYYFNFVNVQSSYRILNCLSGILGGGIFGFLVGYMIYVVYLLFSMFGEMGRTMPLLFASIGSKRRFVNTVKRYSPEFSYEYFTDKVVTILRQLLSEEDLTDNPYYAGKAADIDGKKIVEYEYRGIVGVKQCQMTGSVCHVLVDVFMTDYYYNGSSIKKKRDVFRMVLKKDLSKKMNYHFSLSAIQCKSCGASFDATASRTCPYCGSRYAVEDEDWVVEQMVKK